MIFVTVGTQKFQFDRLIKEMDKLVSKGLIRDEVFAQIGNSSYRPLSFDYKNFLEQNEFNELMNKCDVLITHGGVATIIKGINNKKPVIVVPRLSDYGEHVDNHQIQIVDSFSNMNYILKCENVSQLDSFVERAKNHRFEEYISKRTEVLDVINNYIDSI